MRTPTFFIVGAPKCGTTALYSFLKEHPDIYMPEFKEPNFFCSDFGATYPFAIRHEGTYLSLFEGASVEKQVGEASVWYLYSRKAAGAIASFEPGARIIIMIRNPVDAMHSLHNQHLLSNCEDIYDFEEALAAEHERMCGRRLPSNTQMPEGLYYRQVFRYTDQIDRYLDVFGRDNVHVVVFDDLVNDTASAYADVLRFLGINAAYQPDFRVINQYNRIRNRFLHAFILRPPPKMRDFVRRSIPFRLRRLAIESVRNTNLVATRRPPIERSLRKALSEEFAPEIQRLSELLGRDLISWCRD